MKQTPVKFAQLIFVSFLCISCNSNNSKLNETPRASAWIYSKVTDKMTNEVIPLAVIHSDNVAGITQKLTLSYQKPHGLIVSIQLDGGIYNCTDDDCFLNFKFDNKISSFLVRGLDKDGNNYGEIAPGDVGEFLIKLKRSSALLIEVPVYNKGKLVFEYDVRNVDYAGNGKFIHNEWKYSLFSSESTSNVKEGFDSGFDPTTLRSARNSTPLMSSIGNPKTVDLLLGSGKYTKENVGVVENDGYTVLMMCAVKGDISSLKKLVELGLISKEQFLQKNANNESAIDISNTFKVYSDTGKKVNSMLLKLKKNNGW